MMRQIFLSWVIVLLILGACTAGCTSASPAPAGSSAAPMATPAAGPGGTAPDITGLWTGPAVGHSLTEGYREHNRSRYNITTQRGNAFNGSKEYVRGDGMVYYEQFSGIITQSGEISMADNPKGYLFGRLTGPDTMELQYVDDGQEAKAFLALLTRQKS